MAVEASLDRLVDEADARGPAGRADLAEALKLLSKVTDSRLVARDSRAALATRHRRLRRNGRLSRTSSPTLRTSASARSARATRCTRRRHAADSRSCSKRTVALWRAHFRAARSHPARSARVGGWGHRALTVALLTSAGASDAARWMAPLLRHDQCGQRCVADCYCCRCGGVPGGSLPHQQLLWAVRPSD